MLEEHTVYHDIVQWAESNFEITLPDKSNNLIKLYPAQKYLLTIWNINKRSIFVASRQMGLSTMIAIDALYAASNNNDQSIMILCSSSDVEHMYSCILRNVGLSDGIGVYDDTIKFLNGSRIFIRTYDSNGVRGMGLNKLYLMDWDSVSSQRQSELWFCTRPVLSARKNATVLVAGVPNREKYMNPEKLTHSILALRDSDFFTGNETFRWSDLSIYDEKRIMILKDSLDNEETFKYEFNCGE